MGKAEMVWSWRLILHDVFYMSSFVGLSDLSFFLVLDSMQISYVKKNITRPICQSGMMIARFKKS